MNFELNFFLNNLLFLLVQTQIKKKKKEKQTANENRLTANYFWSVLMYIHSLVRVSLLSRFKTLIRQTNWRKYEALKQKEKRKKD